MSESLRVGAYGWRHDHWRQSFYDEALPEDWQLTFYANEFSTLLVPSSYLAEDRNIEQWCDDVSESFRFYIEWPQSIGSADALLEELVAMGDKLAGIVVSSDIELDINCPLYHCQKSHSCTDVWHPEHPVRADLALFSIDQADLRQQRSWLESYVEDSEGQCRAILLSDRLLDINKLRELKTLIELKGL